MNISTTDRVPFPVDEVFRALLDENFQQSVVNQIGATLDSFTVTPDSPTTDDQVSVQVTRVLSRELLEPRVPGFAKRLVAQGVAIDQSEVWSAASTDGSRTSDMTITVAAARLTGKGSQSLIPAEDGTATDIRIEADVKSTLPLIGSKIVEKATPMVSSVSRAQARALKKWLEEN